MLKTGKQACRFNSIVRDYRMIQGIENLSDLVKDEGDGRELVTPLPVVVLSRLKWPGLAVMCTPRI